MAQSSVESETGGAAASADRARERRSIYALLSALAVVRATTQLRTDLPVAAWMGMTALLLSGRDGSLSPWLGGARIGVLAALTAFFAFLTKESAIWLGPVIAGVLARDGWRGDWRRN